MRADKLPQFAERGGDLPAADQNLRPGIAQARIVRVQPNRVAQVGIGLNEVRLLRKPQADMVEEARVIETPRPLTLQLLQRHRRQPPLLIPGGLPERANSQTERQQGEHSKQNKLESLTGHDGSISYISSSVNHDIGFSAPPNPRK